VIWEDVTGRHGRVIHRHTERSPEAWPKGGVEGRSRRAESKYVEALFNTSENTQTPTPLILEKKSHIDVTFQPGRRLTDVLQKDPDKKWMQKENKNG
jgi:hypothetical protein